LIFGYTSCGNSNFNSEYRVIKLEGESTVSNDFTRVKNMATASFGNDFVQLNRDEIAALRRGVIVT